VLIKGNRGERKSRRRFGNPGAGLGKGKEGKEKKKERVIHDVFNFC